MWVKQGKGLLKLNKICTVLTGWTNNTSLVTKPGIKRDNKLHLLFCVPLADNYNEVFSFKNKQEVNQSLLCSLRLENFYAIVIQKISVERAFNRSSALQ